MPQPDGGAALSGSCRECGHTWTPNTPKDPCPSCGSLQVTISVPKRARDKRHNF